MAPACRAPGSQAEPAGSRERSCLSEMRQEADRPRPQLGGLICGLEAALCKATADPQGRGTEAPRGGQKHQGQQYGRETGLVVPKDGRAAGWLSPAALPGASKAGAVWPPNAQPCLPGLIT